MRAEFQEPSTAGVSRLSIVSDAKRSAENGLEAGGELWVNERQGQRIPSRGRIETRFGLTRRSGQQSGQRSNGGGPRCHETVNGTPESRNQIVGARGGWEARRDGKERLKEQDAGQAASSETEAGGSLVALVIGRGGRVCRWSRPGAYTDHVRERRKGRRRRIHAAATNQGRATARDIQDQMQGFVPIFLACRLQPAVGAISHRQDRVSAADHLYFLGSGVAAVRSEGGRPRLARYLVL